MGLTLWELESLGRYKRNEQQEQRQLLTQEKIKKGNKHSTLQGLASTPKVSSHYGISQIRGPGSSTTSDSGADEASWAWFLLI